MVSIITDMELLSYPNMSDSEETIVRDFLTKITVVGLDNNIKELAIAFRKNYRLKLPYAIDSGGYGKELKCKLVDKRSKTEDSDRD